MSFSTNWDVNKYHDPTEFIEHWNLRKEFMLTHKHKFPEERLAGLAKMFYNMEFLGCIYKSELMILVQNLAEQVDAIVQYRNKKKMKLQRTFVKASDAVKRHIDKTPANTAASKIQYVNFVAAKNNGDEDEEPDNKRFKLDQFIDRPELQKYTQEIKTPTQSETPESEHVFVPLGQKYLSKNQFMPDGYEEQPKLQPPQQHLYENYQYQKPPPQQQQPLPPGTLSKTQQIKLGKQEIQKRNQQNNRYKLRFDLKPEDRALIAKAKSQKGILGKLVLYETQQHAKPYGKLDYAAGRANINMKIVKDETNKKYYMEMDDQFITDIPFPEEVPVRRIPKGHRKYKVPEEVRNEIAEKAFVYFRKYCFTLIDHNTKDYEQISSDNLKNKSNPNKQFQLSMDGIGAKMMKQMGWGGKGLGKDGKGIIEPIQAEIRVYRRGFGQGSDAAFTKSVRDYFQKYLSTGETKRLVFSTDFSKDDRAKLHTIASQFGLLRSRSYGKGDNRHITIERKLSGWDIIEQVLANGGTTDCYTLIKPTDL